MSHVNDCICMYTPEADGGHALYAWELMTALAQARGPFRYEMVSSVDLAPRFHSSIYKAQPILPARRERSSFSTRLGWAANRMMYYPRREWHFLKWLRNRPDVVAVHFQQWTPWLAAPMFRRVRRMGKRILYTVHNVVPHKYPAGVPRAVMDGWIRRASLLCDGLFVHSDQLAGQLSRFLGPKHPPIHVVRHGVWTAPAPPGSDAPAPQSLAERMSAKRLLFFGNIRQNKGLDLLLSAAERLRGYSITIAGEPTDRGYFKTEIVPQVERLRNSGVRINLDAHYTPDEEVPRLFASHSAVVLPYTSGFVAQSGVAFMALACETPIVASEAGGLRELFEEFRIGTTFSRPTPQALADAVDALFTSDCGPKLMEQIRAAKECYCWRAAAETTLAGYLAALNKAEQTNDLAIATIATN
jgi:glycosyltransferase involved in cell wall biosynthesis